MSDPTHLLIAFAAGGTPAAKEALRAMRLPRGVERAFGDVGNFVTAPDGREIAGNRCSAWPSGR